MSYVQTLNFRNWLCYRGDHELRLEPKAYSVTASSEGDPEESNAAGKSALFEAVRFALDGSHRHRKDDEWIAEGEPSGEVRLRMSDGFEVSRSRERGKPTQLRAGKAKGERAQEAIREEVGLSPDEFLDVAYCEQKELSSFVRARPGERFRAASAWFRLGKLSDGEALALNRLKERRLLLEAVEAKVSAAGPPPDPREVAEVGKAVEEAAKEEAEVEASLRECLARRAAREERTKGDVRRRWVASEATKVLAEIRARGWTRKEPLEEAVSVAEAAKKKAEARAWKVAEEHESLRELCEKGFSGTCPVSGTLCPVKDQINERRAEKGERLRVVADDHSAVGEALALYEADLAGVTAILGKARDANRRLRELREEAVRLGPESGIPEAGPEASEVLDEHLRAVREKHRKLLARRDELAAAAEAEGRLSGSRKEAEALRGEVEVLRNAALAFREARRSLAEEGLAEVEAEANHLLSSSGIPLSLRATWEAEGSEPAKHCRSCGTPFPASAKVKSCLPCGAPRGLNAVERLDVRLSKRSGAMEDLAGAAVRIAAGAWVKRDRAVPWGTLLVDEPFGALDAPKRRSFGRALAMMLLGAAGAEQALVTAHSPDVLSMLPGRIEVFASHKGSTVKVVA